jgi:hypothetical protein
VLLKRRITVLNQQVESYKRKVQYAERQAQAAREESARLRKTVADLRLMLAIANAGVGNESEADIAEIADAGPWRDVANADTGKIVAMNEDTGESRKQVRGGTSPFEN